MKPTLLLTSIIILLSSCTSQKKLAYLSNMPETGGESFPMEIPDYRIQARDILYITIKSMTPNGTILDFLSSSPGSGASNYTQGESGQYLFGYDVNSDGKIILPVLGTFTVAGSTIDDVHKVLQEAANKVFSNSTVECKLLNFKFTVIGEVIQPGTYTNYNDYLTIFEAIGRAGGINDFGKRDKILIIRPNKGGTKTFKVNLQDKAILSNEAYFLLPNDVIIVEPESKKIFNLNLPTFSFILTSITSTITTTILLINYLGP